MNFSGTGRSLDQLMESVTEQKADYIWLMLIRFAERINDFNSTGLYFYNLNLENIFESNDERMKLVVVTGQYS